MNRLNTLLLGAAFVVGILLILHISAIGFLPETGWDNEIEAHSTDPGDWAFERTAGTADSTVEEETVEFTTQGIEAHIKHHIRNERENRSAAKFDDSLSSAARAQAQHRAEHNYSGLTHDETGTSVEDFVTDVGACRGEYEAITRTRSTAYHTSEGFNRKTAELGHSMVDSIASSEQATEIVRDDSGETIVIGVGTHITDTTVTENSDSTRPLEVRTTIITCTGYETEFAGPLPVDWFR